ncbi:MAG: hypothetical protein BHW34_03045 [Firmicutes bacterium CAG:176_59_8]|nr:MAG: hypothetical protein BHW34_03045 [Firmicutes bacterium CAG:176_59_8]
MVKWDTLWPGGLTFAFDDGPFKPSTDTFLLGGFAAPRPRDRVCDLGAGIGLLGLLLLAREPSLQVTGIERDAHACAVLAQNAAENRLPLTALCADLRQRETLPAGAFQLAVSNPPYFAPHTGAVAAGQRGAARSEVTCTLAELCGAASYLLRSGGQLCLVYRAARLAELMALLRAHKLEPKELQTVQKTINTPPRLVLLRCRKDGGTGLDIRPPLLLQKGDGSESEALGRCYFRDRE